MGALSMVLPGQVRSFNSTVRVGAYLDAGLFNVKSFRFLADALQYCAHKVPWRQALALGKWKEESGRMPPHRKQTCLSLQSGVKSNRPSRSDSSAKMKQF
jgi:hypothetical protein